VHPETGEIIPEKPLQTETKVTRDENPAAEVDLNVVEGTASALVRRMACLATLLSSSLGRVDQEPAPKDITAACESLSESIRVSVRISCFMYAVLF